MNEEEKEERIKFDEIIMWANDKFSDPNEKFFADSMDEARWAWERKIMRWLANIELRLRKIDEDKWLKADPK